MIRAAIVRAALIGAFAVPALAADSPACELVRMAEWPVRFHGNLPVVDGAINGKKVGILLDTGAQVSLVTKDAATRFDLRMTPTGDYLAGVGGESRILVTRLDELRVGEAVRKNIRVRVVGERPIRGVDFVVGDEFLKYVDL